MPDLPWWIGWPLEMRPSASNHTLFHSSPPAFFFFLSPFTGPQAAHPPPALAPPGLGRGGRGGRQRPGCLDGRDGGRGGGRPCQTAGGRAAGVNNLRHPPLPLSLAFCHAPCLCKPMFTYSRTTEYFIHVYCTGRWGGCKEGRASHPSSNFISFLLARRGWCLHPQVHTLLRLPGVGPFPPAHLVLAGDGVAVCPVG